MTVLVITSSFLNAEKGNGGMPGRETAGRPRNILLNRKTDIGRGVVLKRRVWTPLEVGGRKVTTYLKTYIANHFI